MDASYVLLRSPLSNDTNEVNEDTEHIIDLIVSDVVPKSVSLDEIKSATLSDPEFVQLFKM